MLALGFSKGWRWTALGKHPVARDYFGIGENFPLGEALGSWVNKGYALIASRNDPLNNLCSWRFWAKGAQKEILVCGLVRDSADSVGRAYPLVMLGMGSLENWEGHWDLLPLACERTWAQMESISSRPFRDLNQMEKEIGRIRAPRADWPDLMAAQRKSAERGAGFGRPAYFAAPGSLERGAAPQSGAEIFVSLKDEAIQDSFAVGCLWHSFYKSRLAEIPNMVFMGGSPDEVHLALLSRPLVMQDFVRLWSVCSKGAPSDS